MNPEADIHATTIEALKSLADDNRLAIVRLLAGRELCVCELAEEMAMSDALVSHHLKKLRAVGIVSTRRSGQWLYCRLAPEVLRDLAHDIGQMAVAVPGAASACCSREPVASCGSRGGCDGE